MGAFQGQILIEVQRASKTNKKNTQELSINNRQARPINFKRLTLALAFSRFTRVKGKRKNTRKRKHHRKKWNSALELAFALR